MRNVKKLIITVNGINIRMSVKGMSQDEVFQLLQVAQKNVYKPQSIQTVSLVHSKEKKKMIKKVYSVYDSKGKIFNPPFYSLTHGEAERNFHRVTNDPQTNIHAYPNDYDLYYLGEFDDVKGTFSSLITPEHIQKAITVLEKRSGLSVAESARVIPDRDAAQA